ncbi:tRNA lysidine(34) synthetase TilS [Streptococcus dentasini]
MIYQTIFKDIQKKGYFTSHKKVLVAVSGGVDSMNLLHFLHQYKDDLDITIGVAHVNHKQRESSDKEEAYLKEWTSHQNIPFFVSYFSGRFSEKAARDFRYHFFERLMREKGYTALVTAHHADDQAETIFMRLLRGSRLRHLGGMAAIQSFAGGQLIRPFLTISKSELPTIFHFEDETNASNCYLRNRIRREYLPYLSQENPAFSRHLRDLGEETDLLLTALMDLTVDFKKGNLEVFRAQTKAVQYFLLQDYLANFSDLRLSKPQFNQTLKQLQKSQACVYYLKAGFYLHVADKRFWIDKIGPETDNSFTAKVLEYGNIVSIGQNCFKFGQIGDVDLVSLSPITLRPRQAGDQLDFGNFHKKLRRLFIDEKISIKDRQTAVVAEQDGQIIFVLAGGNLYLRKVPQCVTIRAKLCIETKETGDL